MQNFSTNQPVGRRIYRAKTTEVLGVGIANELGKYLGEPLAECLENEVTLEARASEVEPKVEGIAEALLGLERMTLDQRESIDTKQSHE